MDGCTQFPYFTYELLSAFISLTIMRKRTMSKTASTPHHVLTFFENISPFYFCSFDTNAHINLFESGSKPYMIFYFYFWQKLGILAKSVPIGYRGEKEGTPELRSCVTSFQTKYWLKLFLVVWPLFRKRLSPAPISDVAMTVVSSSEQFRKQPIRIP